MSTAVVPRETYAAPAPGISSAPPPARGSRPGGGGVRRRLRPVLFWLHLALGSALGLVILTQALTGISIAYRRQVVTAVIARQVPPPPPGATRLPLDTLVARAAAGGPRPSGLTVRRDPRAPVAVQFGRERAAYVDPYTGRVLPGAPRLEAFFAYTEGVHRWLAVSGKRSELGEAATAASVLTFLGLLLSGLYLWLPARWTRRNVRAVALVTRGARGRARDWNWHHVAGLWASPVLLVVIVSGVFMAFEWPTRLVARATGSPVAERGGPAGRPGGGPPGGLQGGLQGGPRGGRGADADAAPAPRASLDTLAAHALAAVPGGWYAVQLRLGGGPGQGPPGGGPPGGGRPGAAGITASVTRSADLRPDLTTQLTLDPATGAVRARQDYARQDVARRVRGWMHPVHSGEGFGVLGETVAVLGALAAAVLVWTGLALALRRLRRRLARDPLGGRGTTRGITEEERMSSPRLRARGTLALILLCLSAGAARAQTATARTVRAANAFLTTLDTAQRRRVLFAFDDDQQRRRWSNFPTGIFRRAGVDLGELSAAQRSAALAMVASVLSRRGFEKVQQIVEADEVLKANEGGRTPFGGRLLFGRDLYYVSILGTPSERTPWMLQFGGHHLALNVTVVGERGVLTPTLTGAQPALYTLGGKTVRPLGQESDKAFALLNALDDSQREQAVLNYRVADLVLGPGQDSKTIQPEGLKATAMNDRQRAMLLDLISEWAGIVHERAAAARIAELRADLGETWFAWSGPTTVAAGQNGTAYYRIQGPHLVIEYAPQRTGGDPSLHVHTMYRDPTNDYGRALTAP